MALHLTVSIDLEHWEAASVHTPATQTKKNLLRKDKEENALLSLSSVFQFPIAYIHKVDFSIRNYIATCNPNGFCQQLFLCICDGNENSL